MKSAHKKLEGGQILVFVVLFVIGLFAMLALVLDGGNTYAKRRAAQNAADAGALAGARTLCMKKDASLAVTVAKDYAIHKNEAYTATVNIDEVGYVTVNTSITFDTFFAHLIGRPQMTAEAQAVAGCFPPSSGSFLPVAWACKAPGEGSELDCDEKIVTDDQLQFYLDHPRPNDPSDPYALPNDYHTVVTSTIWPELYVIMDALKTDEDLTIPICKPDGPLNCDITGDGVSDLVVGGDRSWLDLDGKMNFDGPGGGASELINWIEGGAVPLKVPFWTNGKAGATSNVYKAVDAQLDYSHYFSIPVFNAICGNYPPVGCPGLYPEGPFYNTATGKTYFHVVGSVYFYVTCVWSQSLSNDCPGNEAAIKAINEFALTQEGEDLGIKKENKIDSIEGYFVEGIPEDVSGGDPNGFDTGTYTLRLYK